MDSATGDTGVAAGFVGAAAAGSAVRYTESQLSLCRTEQDLTLVVEREVDKADPEEILSLLQGAELKEHVEDDATNSLKIKVSDISYLLPLNFFFLYSIIFYRFYKVLKGNESFVGNAPILEKKNVKHESADVFN